MPDDPTTPERAAARPDIGDVTPFPAGSRILHIGPPKTGTTALQAACWQARASLLAQGVRYAGGQQHAPLAARAVTGRPTITGDTREVPSIRWWKALVAEIEAAREPRVLYSSEALAEADEAAVRRIRADLGSGLQVLVTLRPVDAVLTSQWQQSVQTGSGGTIDAWLRIQLGDETSEPAPGPQLVLRQGELVRRWADVVGPDRVTVIVVDRRDPAFLFRSLEALLGLRAETLRAVDDQANRSLSEPELEVIRRMNALSRAAGVPNGTRTQLVTYGAAAAAKQRPATPGAPGVRLPAWAAARAAEMGEAASTTIASSGVRVLGNSRSLVPATPSGDGGPGPGVAAATIDADTAAALAMGVAWGTGLRLGPKQPVPPRDLPLVFVPTRTLVRIIARRVLARLRRTRRLAGLGED
jgi:hypothetical protein